MKKHTFILAALMLTALFASACTFCVGDDCSTENSLSDLEEDAIQVDTQESDDILTTEPTWDYPEPETDLLPYVSPNLGMSFQYPSEFIRGDGSFKYWDNFTLTNLADGAFFDIHINPDGFGPIFADKTYTVEEGADGKLQITDVVESTDEYADNGMVQYIFSLAASNGKNYLVLFSVEGNTTKYQDVFEDFIGSFTVL